MECSLTEAIGAAMAAGDLGEAISLLQDATNAGPNPVARHLLGGLLFCDDDFAGARRQLELAFSEWRETGNRRAAALAAADLADLHVSGYGNRVVGQGWQARGRRLLAHEGRCVEQGYVELAVIACEVEVDQLESASEMALELASEFGDTELEVLALADSGYVLVVRGHVAEGLSRLDEAMAALSAGEVANPGVIGRSYCALLSACDRVGDINRAHEWTRAITESWTGPLGGRPRASQSHCRLVYGSVLCTAGQWREGEAAILEVLAPQASSYLAHRAEAAARLASLRLLQGRVEEAAELLRGLEDRPGSCETLARVHLVTGELDLAHAIASRGLDTAAGDGLRAGALRSLLVEVELARQQVAAAAAYAAALEEQAEAVECSLLRAEAALARGRVAAAQLEPEAAVASLNEALANLAPDERPLAAATISLELALALREANNRGAAIDHARRALAVFERLGAALLVDRTEALLRSLGSRTRPLGHRAVTAVAGLTEREQQVLELLRGGLTNTEIAERLFISTKTAEHHVSRVLAKLGVPSRAAAAAVATAAAIGPESSRSPD
jgi:DNA-binding NarL/FixJ family response regulator